ncbi:hypothetical protein AB0M34_19680 [Nocardia sp. NPDC050193]
MSEGTALPHGVASPGYPDEDSSAHRIPHRRTMLIRSRIEYCHIDTRGLLYRGHKVT